MHSQEKEKRVTITGKRKERVKEINLTNREGQKRSIINRRKKVMYNEKKKKERRQVY
jgi:hypothetical protein